MTIDVEKYNRLKKKALEAREKASKAEGVLEEQMKKLKSEYGVETIEEAQKLLQEMEKEQADSERAYNEAMAAFEKKWGEKV